MSVPMQTNPESPKTECIPLQLLWKVSALYQISVASLAWPVTKSLARRQLASLSPDAILEAYQSYVF